VGNATRDDPKLTDAEKDKLTEKGAQQATALGAVLATVAVDRLYTSPANRTVATAESVLKALSTRPGLALVPLPGVGPITLGKAPSEKSPAINSLVASWQAGRDLRLEGGENLADMTARAKKALADIVKSVRAGQTAVVVAHGEILLSYLCEFDVARTMQALVSYRLPNACILAFDATEKGALFLDLFAAPAAPASRPSEK
jgi:broad specificity phosphatase PhoE